MLTSGLVRELKASTSAWETFGGRAAKLASQLQQMATAFGSFVDALQTISDSVNTVNGVSRDIGAALTRFCLRQRAVEMAIRKWGEMLQKHCADDLGRRGGEWRQTVLDLERRHQRNCKRFKTSGGGKHHNKNRQQIEAENRNFFVELLHTQRKQCTEFVVGTLLPVINAQMVLLDEGTHIQPILDSIEKSVNESDTTRLIHALLEDIDACNGHGMTLSGGESEQRIGLAMAQCRAKSASQARLYGVGTERTDEEDDRSLAIAPCHSLNCDGSAMLTTANRNSMPPPSAAVNSHYQFFSSCPPSAVATISSSASSAFVAVGSPPSKRNNCGGTVGSAAMANAGGTSEDIWQQNFSRSVPSSHQRLPLPQPFVHHQTVADESAVSPTLSSIGSDTSPQNQCQKPPMPKGWGSKTNCQSKQQQQQQPQQNHQSLTNVPSQPNAMTATTILPSSSNQLRALPAKVPMPTNHSIPSAAIIPPIDQNGTQLALSSLPPPPPAQHAESTDSGSHCSSALIAETLQQIDRLGFELDNYCDGFNEVDNANGGGSERHRFAVSSSSRPFVGLHHHPPTMAFVVAETAATSVRFRQSAAVGSQFQYQSSAAAVSPPCPSMPPPPLPPQRRNSSISSATPSAPSIAQLRSIGASAPFGPFRQTLTSHPPRNAFVPSGVVVPPSPSPMMPPPQPPVHR